jgi:hypothetical protein
MSAREFRQHIVDLLAESRRREVEAERIVNRPAPSGTNVDPPTRKPAAIETQPAPSLFKRFFNIRRTRQS